MMKKTLATIFILLVAVALHAQEAAPEPTPQNVDGEPMFDTSAFTASGFNWKEFPWNLAIGTEYASNTRESHALGFGVYLDRYLFTPWLALALSGMLHDDVQTVSSTEAKLSLRLYLPELREFRHTFFFAQWGFGAGFYREEGREISSYLLDVAAGARIILGDGILHRFYVEPYVRTGFPFLFGIGVLAGRRFNF